MKLAWPIPVGTCCLFLGFAAIAAACNDDSTDPQDEGLLFEQFAETYRQTQCERVVACGFAPDVDTCKATVQQDYRVAQAIAAVAYGDLTYDPKAAQTCIETLKAENCEGYLLLTQSVVDACDVVFGNRRGEGESCVAAIQCQGSQSVCEGACGEGCCVGVCKGVSAGGQEGDECNDFAPCTSGLRCLPNPVPEMPAICQTLAGPNEACTSENSCIDGYACDQTSGKCFQQAASGATCNPALPNSCGSLNEFCDVDQQKCVALPRAGSACGVNGEQTYCARSTYCNEGMECEQYPGVGEACLFDYACLGNLFCSGDPDFVCLPLPNPPVCVNFQ